MNGEAYRSKMEPENLLKDGKSCIGFSVDGVICYLYSQATFLQWSQSRPFIEFSRSTDSLGFLEPEPCSYRDLLSQSTSLIGTSVCQCLCPVRSLGPLEPNLSIHWDLWSHPVCSLGPLEPKMCLYLDFWAKADFLKPCNSLYFWCFPSFYLYFYFIHLY